MKSLAMFEPKKQIGFTLIELMIVVVIMGIVLAMGIPNFRTWIENGRIRTGAESVFNGLNLARSEAIRRNESVQFRFDPAFKSTWAICQQDTPTTSTFTLCTPLGAAATSGNLGNRVIQARYDDKGSTNVQVGTDTAMGTLTTALPVALGGDRVTFDGMGRLVQTIGGAAANNAVRVDVVNPKLPAAQMRRLVIQISFGGQVRLCDPDPGLSATDPRRCT
ncbi:MAG: GspH/FimT family pseudopilin [Burkholderiales bacterium]